MCDRTVNVKRIRNITRSDSFIVSMDVLQRTTYHAATEQLEIFGQSKSFVSEPAGDGTAGDGFFFMLHDMTKVPREVGEEPLK